MKMRNFLVMSALFAYMTISCDTRDDYFFEHCEEPTIDFIWSQKDSLVDDLKHRYIIVELKWGDEANIKFDFADQYGEISECEVEYGGGGHTPGFDYYVKHDQKILNQDQLAINFDIENNNIKIKEGTKSGESIYHIAKDLNPETKAKAQYLGREEIRLYVKLKNKLGKVGYAYIYLKMLGNPMPDIDIKIENTEKEFEKRISAVCKDSTKEMTRFEYCIDGEVSKDYGFEFDDYEAERVAAGDAAWNGTYITSTSINGIYHAFQQEDHDEDYVREHTIYVRYQDQYGCWSKWVKKIIRL